MSNFLDIEKALISAYQAVGTLVPTGYPGAELADAAIPDGLWAHVHNVRTESKPVTLGGTGEDNHAGFLQIDLNYPRGKGSGELLVKADELITAFPAGRALTYNGQEVKVSSSGLGPGRYVGGYYRVSIRINYYARTTRNL